mgnify:CR=1 FL=1
MLHRMYTRWAERHGYTYQLMDYEAGDEAGIKSATIKFTGEYAFGWLRTETEIPKTLVEDEDLVRTLPDPPQCALRHQPATRADQPVASVVERVVQWTMR